MASLVSSVALTGRVSAGSQPAGARPRAAGVAHPRANVALRQRSCSVPGGMRGSRLIVSAADDDEGVPTIVPTIVPTVVAAAAADALEPLIMVDTTDAFATLRAQLDDLLGNDSTRATYCLASPSNRRATARGGYDQEAFDAMVRGPTYRALLSQDRRDYEVEVLTHRWTGVKEDSFQASVRVVHAYGGYGGGGGAVFDFVMSLQQADVVGRCRLILPNPS